MNNIGPKIEAHTQFSKSHPTFSTSHPRQYDTWILKKIDGPKEKHAKVTFFLNILNRFDAKIESSINWKL